MTPFLLVALWVHAHIQDVSGAACPSASPMAFPITDVAIDPNIPDSLMRGIPARVGTPPQSIVMLPWPDLNNTYIYDDQSDCDPSIIWNDKICEIRRGGYFLETKSTSYTKSNDLVAAGGANQELGTRGSELGVPKLLSTSLAGTDLFGAGTSKPSDLMPFGIPRMRWDHGYTILHALGLGSDSTYLNTLIKAGQIPSRVWSIFWGRMWSGASDMDGVFVLGGYDKEKVIGRNFTQPLDYSEDTGCWTGMKVTVSDFLVNFRNGTDVSIMPRNSAVKCCIVPQRHLLWETPSSIVEGFEKATKMNSTGLSFGLHWGGRQYNTSSDLFDGEVTFVLSSGLQVRIPNSQLLTPAVEIDRNGSRITNPKRTELVVAGIGDDNPATLGRYFLTAAYLMVDHDAHSFTMWQANPTTKSNPVPVLHKSDCEGEGSGQNQSGADNANGEVAETAVSSGTIAGAMVGGVVGLAVIAAAVFFFVRRRKRNMNPDQAAEKPPVEMPGRGQGYHPVPAAAPYKTTEMDGSPDRPAELSEHLNPSELQGSVSPWTATAGTYRESLVTPSVVHEMDGTSMLDSHSRGH